MAAMLIARFGGDVDRLKEAYDRAHNLIVSRGGATSFGELRHHCAVSDEALYIVGVWDSEESIRTRWSWATTRCIRAKRRSIRAKPKSIASASAFAPKAAFRQGMEWPNQK